MIRSSCLAILLCTGAAAADGRLPVTDGEGLYTLHTLWIEGGGGSGVSDGDVGDVSLGGTTFDQTLDGEWRPGLHAGVEWSRSRLELDGEGWSLGVAVWYDQAPGRITAASTPYGPVTVDADLEVEVLSLAIIPAWTWRFDGDDLARIATREWQMEAGPVVAIGAARARIGDGDQSSPGFAWQAGARLRLHGELAGGLRAGLYLGALWLEARSEWDNTGVAVFRGLSPIAGLSLGYEL